ncbi:hypothetical protein [Clostridium magnum]|uniref:Uncharacterized protein n=1 Tax=Clostridium magnum DSM 2767 TaxID=1121326 RepID=A0A161YJ73_9CLOT|nr:hypothetical protein [Clostridium magnum]KZL90462.1 hypothetical protein CLMAG_42330 [Clostridium magnum DSM 2767]SHH85797.1 hypothetical protein SAMN02745944_01610 [Clostridium magnum DSM 2767]
MEEYLIKPEELVDVLEEDGEISIYNGEKEFFIQTVDDKEGYSYVSSTNQEFGSSREAAEWAISELHKSNM